jgi:hypothetical protein
MLEEDERLKAYLDGKLFMPTRRFVALPSPLKMAQRPFLFTKS